MRGQGSRCFGLFVVAVATLLAACGSDPRPVPGGGCALNSDCKSPLVCKFSKCHGACVVSDDCPTGNLCVRTVAISDAGTAADADEVNVCQLPVEVLCVYNSDCSTPLVCARDAKCRNQCQQTVDCISGQVCADSKVCALPEQLVTGTNDVPVVSLDGGIDVVGRDGEAGGSGGVGGQSVGGQGGGGAGAGGGAGLPAGGSSGGGGAGGQSGGGGSGGGQGAGIAGGGGQSGGGGSGGGQGAGITGGGGQSGAGGMSGTGGVSGAVGTGGTPVACTPPCDPGRQCVSGTCAPCGAAGEICCGATCNANLTCASGTCTCGGASQACCGGTMCAPGLGCMNGTCACGGAKQLCCPGKTCNGSLVCGGLRCGCAVSCDDRAVLKNDGTLWIGNTGAPIPAFDGSDLRVKSYSMGRNTTCAVKLDGTVLCWGSNLHGSLGTGDPNIPASPDPLPVRTAIGGPVLSSITLVVSAAHGSSLDLETTCAIGVGGAVWCWGSGVYGKLGNGATVDSAFAVPVLDGATGAQFSGARQLAVGQDNVCAIKTDDSVWCWGSNNVGQANPGSPATVVPYPTQITLAGAARSLAIVTPGPYVLICASTADKTVWCWGQGQNGNGDGTMGMSNPGPVQVVVAPSTSTPLVGANEVVDWGGSACALKADGTIWCWGVSASQYVAPNNMFATGIASIGRNCYLDVNNEANTISAFGTVVACP